MIKRASSTHLVGTPRHAVRSSRGVLPGPRPLCKTVGGANPAATSKVVLQHQLRRVRDDGQAGALRLAVALRLKKSLAGKGVCTKQRGRRRLRKSAKRALEVQSTRLGRQGHG